MADKLAKYFGNHIKGIRKEHEDTKESLAKKLTEFGLSVTEDEIAAWEKGKYIPNREILNALCKLYKLEFYSMFGAKDEAEFGEKTMKMLLSNEEALAIVMSPPKSLL